MNILKKLFLFCLAMPSIFYAAIDENKLSLYANTHNELTHDYLGKDEEEAVNIDSLLTKTRRFLSEENGNKNKEQLEKVKKDYQPKWNVLFEEMFSKYKVNIRNLRAVERFVFASPFLYGDFKNIIDFCAIFTFCFLSDNDNIITAMENHTCNFESYPNKPESVDYQLPYIATVAAQLVTAQ